MNEEILNLEGCTKRNNNLYTFDSKFSSDLKFSIEKWDSWYKEKLKSGSYKKDFYYYKENYFPLTIAQLEKSKPLNKDIVFLEIGSGEFFLGNLIANRVKLVIGVDLCPTALKIAQEMFENAGITNYLLIQADILDMPLKDNVIDLIYGGGTIEHFKDTQTCIDELYRVLKPTGVSFNTVPYLNIGSLTYRQIWGNIPNFPILRELAELIHIKILGGKHMVFGYEFSFTIPHLRKLHEKAGFKKIEITKFDVHLKFEYIPHWLRKPFIWLSSNVAAFWPMIKAVAVK